MMGDIMTKPTDKRTFLRCCAYIMTDRHVDLIMLTGELQVSHHHSVTNG